MLRSVSSDSSAFSELGARCLARICSRIASRIASSGSSAVSGSTALSPMDLFYAASHRTRVPDVAGHSEVADASDNPRWPELGRLLEKLGECSAPVPSLEGAVDGMSDRQRPSHPDALRDWLHFNGIGSSTVTPCGNIGSDRRAPGRSRGREL